MNDYPTKEELDAFMTVLQALTDEQREQLKKYMLEVQEGR